MQSLLVSLHRLFSMHVSRSRLWQAQSLWAGGLAHPWCPPAATSSAFRTCSTSSSSSTQVSAGPDSTLGGPVADVTIVGGGMVGAALAALLAANTLTKTMRILLIDQQVVVLSYVPSQPQSFNWSRPAVPELRVSTITPASSRVLQRAGAWEQVQANSAHFGAMQVWDTAGPGCIRWQAQDAGRDTMGCVAENSLIQAALMAGLQESHLHVISGSEPISLLRPGVTCMWPAAIQHLHLPPSSTTSLQPDVSSSSSPGGSLARLEFQGGSQVLSRLVVAADGGASRVRSWAGLRTFGWPYHQRGLVATVSLEGGAGTDTAWQRFLPTGPLALLPVRDNLANIVWSTTPDMAAQLQKMTPDAFATAVNQALTSPPSTDSWSSDGSHQQRVGPWGMLSQLASSAAAMTAQASGGAQDRYLPPPRVTAWLGSPPRSFPLQLKQAGRYVRPRLALIGDAAHTVHPLAGQGVNLGFGDAEALADALIHACEVGGDPGEVLLLQDRYERPRMSSVLAMTSALDGLYRVFGLQAPPLAAVRNLGLGLLNASGPLKTRIMQFAMGI